MRTALSSACSVPGPLQVGVGPSIWESVVYSSLSSHYLIVKKEAYGNFVSLLGGEIILGYDFKTFTQFLASSFG